MSALFTTLEAFSKCLLNDYVFLFLKDHPICN